MVESWEAELDDLFARIAGRFSRVEPRKRAFAYVRGLLAPLERRNGWTLAEQAGDRSPDGMQALLCSPCWDADAVRDDVRDYVVEHLGDPAAVLIADETGFLKKGTRSAGVQRQYSGTAGRTENCQIGTFLCYASGKGRALIDRELYLPKSWTEDRQRCRAAAVPQEVEFATKPQQARAMLERAIAAGVPFAWFTADEAYGQNPGLRGWLQEQDVPYVMATRCDDEVASGLFTTTRVDQLVARVPAGAWTRLSCGDGAHGPRRYDWVRLPIRREFPHGRRGWVLARRSISDPTDIAYYVCFGPRGTRQRELVRVAGSRWAVEESFQTAKNEVGLDQYQVRRYDAWYAHITLAMTAAAFLVATRAAQAEKGAPIPAQTRSSR
ncbi:MULTISPECIES: IS701 family transposase [Micromonospora]|uniref:IS701 family transposase n=1 Tax=Micromonospora solifontis TaxID=2487138 RepID=A0ABX9W8I8_9ACTN|nr:MULTISPECIES: IS701 family transposase [Micromonospora]NES17359.1 IS701 family transposase [Micromonospora sp. PPF5-17B]NES39859.1 IS701 family transposase [Micromonospora solifontis]NES59215.1 IS701 family transposase [Micromonospora sp. PPF5-6]RNL83542.1 IS701 family transposase [Micromonospora solifontis]